MLRFLIILIAATVAILLRSLAFAADDRPNIVLLLCDDIGAHELGIYGHPTHKTPHLDRLATTGIYFETGYATPICHPTRFQLMTGQYGHHNGVYQFPGRPGGPPKSGAGADDIASHLTIGKIFSRPATPRPSAASGNSAANIPA